jgi:hypothetical protein
LSLQAEEMLSAAFVSDSHDATVGAYVVHVEHGIARYMGLKEIEQDNIRVEFMVLEFAEQARLYVPLIRLDLIQKYRSARVYQRLSQQMKELHKCGQTCNPRNEHSVPVGSFSRYMKRPNNEIDGGRNRDSGSSNKNSCLIVAASIPQQIKVGKGRCDNHCHHSQSLLFDSGPKGINRCHGSPSSAGRRRNPTRPEASGHQALAAPEIIRCAMPI